MDQLIGPIVLLLRLQATHLRESLDARLHPKEGDAGVGALEMAIIALGLMALAGLLIAAITAAVTRRTDQIK